MASSNKEEWLDSPPSVRAPAEEEWGDAPPEPKKKYKTDSDYFAEQAGPLLDAMSVPSNAITTGALDLISRLARSGKGIDRKYFQGTPQPPDKIMTEEFGMSPWAAIPLGIVSSAASDPMSLFNKFRPVARGMDAASKRLYQTGFRNVIREFPDQKQHAMNDAGEKFIERLRTEKVLKGGSDPREVELRLRNWQRKEIGGQMNELKKNVGGQRFDMSQMVAPYMDVKNKASRDAIPKAIVDAFEKDVLAPEMAMSIQQGGLTIDDILRKARQYSSMASGKKGAQGDIYKQFARESDAKQAAASVSKGMRDFAKDRMIEASAQALPPTPEEYNRVKQLFTDYGNVETAMPALRKMAKAEKGRKGLTAFDALIGFSSVPGFAAQGLEGALIPIGALAAKKGANWLQSTQGATRVGNILRDAAESGVWDNIARRGLLRLTE